MDDDLEFQPISETSLDGTRVRYYTILKGWTEWEIISKNAAEPIDKVKEKNL